VSVSKDRTSITGPQHSASCPRAPRVALLTNFIPPYRLPLFQELANLVGELVVYVSVPMEGDRAWQPDYGNLDVRSQHTVSCLRRSRHSLGFEQDVYVHFPYSTVPDLLRYRPDVVISAELGFRTLSACIYRMLSPRSRLIVWGTLSEHTEASRDALRRSLRRVLVRRAEAILVNGTSGQRYFERLGVAPEDIFVVRQTPSLAFYADLLGKPSVARVRLLYSGRLIQLKGLQPFTMALAAWAAAHPQRELELWVVGDGPERDSMAAVLRPSNLSLTFFGHQAQEELPGLYAQADLFVFPTLADEWGVVVNEALLCGLPVLGSVYSQAVTDLVKPGHTGWHFRPDDPADTMRALDEALGLSKEQVAVMGHIAREEALALTPRASAEAIVQAIESCWR